MYDEYYNKFSDAFWPFENPEYKKPTAPRPFIEDSKLFKEKLIQSYFTKFDCRTELDTTHIGVILFFRESGCADIREKENFSHWVAMEINRLTQIKPIKQVESNKVVLVLRIREYQKQCYAEIKQDFYKIVGTERFLSHVIYGYLLTETGWSEEVLERYYRVDSEKYNFTFGDYIRFNEACKHDIGDEYDLSPTDELRMHEFWKKNPLYDGDARQYIIHSKLDEDREYRRCVNQIKLQERKKASYEKKKRRHNRKK